MLKPLTSRALFVTVFALSSLLAACGAAPIQTPTSSPEATAVPAATNTPTQSAFDNPAIPFEAVVQIWAATYDEVGDLEVSWTGSGTIISPDGMILTNAHVVLPDRYFPVDELIIAMTVNQDEMPEPAYFAQVLQADANLDLAVIQIIEDYDGNTVDLTSLDLPYVTLGNSDQLNLGDRLTILGYPGIGGETVTLTIGEVSGFTSQPEYGTRAFVKTSATIAGGNSGGMAADAAGNLVGVPTKMGYGGDDQYADCRVLADTNRDGLINEADSCIPTGGFINALRPVALALPLIEAAKRGEISIIGVEEPVAVNPVAGGLVSDDFSDETSGWDVYSFESGSAYYFGGEYYLEDIPGDPYYQARSYLNIANVEMSIDIRVDQSNGDNEVDFICRYVDSDNTYEFRLFEDGYVGISKWLAGEYVNLVEAQAGIAPLGDTTHRVTVVCDGSYLSLSVDGQLVAETNDDSFSSGDLGLAVFAPSAGERFVAAFDNFTATTLGTEETEGASVIFDDFSDPASGWVEDTNSDSSLYYEQGRYFMGVNPNQYYVYSVLPDDYSNILVFVDVNIEQPAHDGDIGILCRYVDQDNFYALEVSEDGYYSIWKRVNGEVTYLVEWTSSTLVPIDSSPFLISASCHGAQLAVGINGEILVSITDTDLTIGRVGLTAGTWQNGGLVVSFDNFEVIEY
ncbi:MAG: serine protease [Anaerolineales bacterium]